MQDAPRRPPVVPGVVAELVRQVRERPADRDRDVIVRPHRTQASGKIAQRDVKRLAIFVGRIVVHDDVAHGRAPVKAIERQEVGPSRQRHQPLGRRLITRGRVGGFAVERHLEVRGFERLQPIVHADLEAVPENLPIVIDRAALHGASGGHIGSVNRRRDAVAAIVDSGVLLQAKLQAEQEITRAGSDLDRQDLIVILPRLRERDLILPEDPPFLAHRQLLAVRCADDDLALARLVVFGKRREQTDAAARHIDVALLPLLAMPVQPVGMPGDGVRQGGIDLQRDVVIDAANDDDAIDPLLASLDRKGEIALGDSAEPIGLRERAPADHRLRPLHVAVGVVPRFMIPRSERRQKRLRHDAVVRDDLAHHRRTSRIVDLEQHLARPRLVKVQIAHRQVNGEVLAVGVVDERRDAVLQAMRRLRDADGGKGNDNGQRENPAHDGSFG